MKISAQVVRKALRPLCNGNFSKEQLFQPHRNFIRKCKRYSVDILMKKEGIVEKS